MSELAPKAKCISCNKTTANEVFIYEEGMQLPVNPDGEIRAYSFFQTREQYNNWTCIECKAKKFIPPSGFRQEDYCYED